MCTYIYSVHVFLMNNEQPLSLPYLHPHHIHGLSSLRNACHGRASGHHLHRIAVLLQDRDGSLWWFLGGLERAKELGASIHPYSQTKN